MPHARLTFASNLAPQVHLSLTGDPTEMRVSWRVKGESCPSRVQYGASLSADPAPREAPTGDVIEPHPLTQQLHVSTDTSHEHGATGTRASQAASSVSTAGLETSRAPSSGGEFSAASAPAPSPANDVFGQCTEDDEENDLDLFPDTVFDANGRAVRDTSQHVPESGSRALLDSTASDDVDDDLHLALLQQGDVASYSAQVGRSGPNFTTPACFWAQNGVYSVRGQK